jgi:hypothetical protein
MTHQRSRSFWSVFAIGAVTGYFASIAMEPQPLSAASKAPNTIPNRLADVENQLADLQELLAGLQRGEDGEFLFLDPVAVDQPSSDMALHVNGNTVIEELTASRVVECDILICSDTGLFSRNLVVHRDGTLQVEGTLDARTADVRLPPDGF